MQNKSTTQQTMVPEARGALDNMKYEIAGELGIQQAYELLKVHAPLGN